ncbi:hypothetical protein E6H18_08020 [Candidatus Bathyarchaeota archaeon]|nr:MAG: hypothetical protein E6H18_08020 [Candidatus Bathyarchaeota archaeon]
MKILSLFVLVLALSFAPTIVPQAAGDTVIVSINCSTNPPTINPDPAFLVVNQSKIQWTINQNCTGIDGFSGLIPIARVISSRITPAVDTGPFTPAIASNVLGPFTSPAGLYKYGLYACSGTCNPCPGTGCTLLLEPQIQLTTSLIGGTLVPISALALLAPYIAIASILALSASVLVYLRRPSHSSRK